MTAHEAGLEATFEDVVRYAALCRFEDCSHAVEPGCRVLEAVSDGVLDLERVENFKRIEREIAHQSRRKSVHDRRDERVETKGRQSAKRIVMNAKGRRSGR